MPSSSHGHMWFTIISFLLSFLLTPINGDFNNLYPEQYVSNPVARHVSYNIEVNKPGIAQLSGFEENSHPLEYYIMSLPSVGKLYETSQNYRSYGSDPKNAPTPIQGIFSKIVLIEDCFSTPMQCVFQ